MIDKMVIIEVFYKRMAELMEAKTTNINMLTKEQIEDLQRYIDSLTEIIFNSKDNGKGGF